MSLNKQQRYFYYIVNKDDWEIGPFNSAEDASNYSIKYQDFISGMTMASIRLLENPEWIKEHYGWDKNG